MEKWLPQEYPNSCHNQKHDILLSCEYFDTEMSSCEPNMKVTGASFWGSLKEFLKKLS